MYGSLKVISDFRSWDWLKKCQNTDHWPWWFCGSRIETSIESLYYKYLMLLNVKKPTNIFIPESWTMVWVWQCFQTFLALNKTWPSKMLGFSFATQLPWSRVWQHYAFKATSTSHASCFPKSFCFQRCISTFKANLTKNKHPIKLINQISISRLQTWPWMKGPNLSKKKHNMMKINIWMFPKIVVPPNHPILIGFSIIFTIPFWGTPISGNTQNLDLFRHHL